MLAVLVAGVVRRLDLTRDEQGLTASRHPPGNGLTQLHARVASKSAPANGHDAQRVFTLEQHHGPGCPTEEVERVGEDGIEDVVQVEHRVQCLPRVEQRRVHLQPLSHRGVQDPLVDEEAAEPVQVDLLLDRVEAEAEPERGDRAAQDPRLTVEQRRSGAPRGHEGGEAEDDDDDEGQEPELHPAPLDQLDRRRPRLAEACHPGLVPDSLADLHWELIHWALVPT